MQEVAKPVLKAQQFLLLPYETKAVLSQRSGSDAAKYWKSWAVWTKKLQEAGILRGGGALQNPETARTIRQSPEQRPQAKNGSFAAGSAQISGYLVLEVSSLEEAERWSQDCPAVTGGGAVEIRPMVPMMAGDMAGTKE